MFKLIKGGRTSTETPTPRQTPPNSVVSLERTMHRKNCITMIQLAEERMQLLREVARKDGLNTRPEVYNDLEKLTRDVVAYREALRDLL